MSKSGPLRAHLDHIGLGSADPPRLAAFYTEALGFEFRKTETGLLGEGSERRLHLSSGSPNSLAFAAFRMETHNELQDLKTRLNLASWSMQAFASPWFSEAISIRDPDGNRFAFGLADHDAGADGPRSALPARLQHVVVASRNPTRIVTFFQDVLGFVLSDSVVDDGGGLRSAFLRCNEEHHSFAVFLAEKDRLDHHCYESTDWDSLKHWADHMATLNVPIVWGPGRHGAGNNLFIFVHDPDANWVEISAELEILAADRPVRNWPHEERTLNLWGRGLLRS